MLMYAEVIRQRKSGGHATVACMQPSADVCEDSASAHCMHTGLLLLLLLLLLLQRIASETTYADVF
jgi:hypothetical protein